MEPYKNRKLDLNQPVDVYRCLNRPGVAYSVRQNGVVVAHTQNFVLKDCTFFVNEKGRQRVLQEKQKHVHAWITGMVGDVDDIQLSFSHVLRYDPYKFASFYIDLLNHAKRSLETARCVYTQEGRLYVQ